MDLDNSLLQISMAQQIELQNSLFFPIYQLNESVAIPDVPMRFTFTEEVVQLLTQQIQERVSWEHQKWLLSPNKEENMFQQVRENIISVGTLSQKNQKFIEEINQKKIHNLGELKTPEIVPDISANSFQNFLLEHQIVEKTQKQKTWHCSCHKTKCLKMYCQCFRNGSTCINCECQGCSNTDENNQQRQSAVEIVKKKQPTAFIQHYQYKGCRCTKSNCEKAYCDCYANNLMCGKYCECKNCHNCKRVNSKRNGNKNKNNRCRK